MKLWGCGERRLYLSYSANADRTISQSTCSSLILSWPATPQSGSSLYIVLPTDNIFSLLLALNLTRSLHSLKWRWLNRSTSLHFTAPPTFRRHSIDLPQYLWSKVANGCHIPDLSWWHWFSEYDPSYPPQMTGNDPRYEPTAKSIDKGKSSTSWHIESSWRLMTSVVCAAEFLGRPVETNIVVTAKKRKRELN